MPEKLEQDLITNKIELKMKNPTFPEKSKGEIQQIFQEQIMALTKKSFSLNLK